MSYQEVDLNTLNSGIIPDLFAEEWPKILANIADENVSPTATRKLVFEIHVTPTEDRGYAAVQVKSSTKLATVKPHKGSLALSFDGTQVRAYTSDPKQPELDGIPKVTPMPRAVGGQ